MPGLDPGIQTGGATGLDCRLKAGNDNSERMGETSRGHDALRFTLSCPALSRASRTPPERVAAPVLDCRSSPQ
jgi:hypothetical protein